MPYRLASFVCFALALSFATPAAALVTTGTLAAEMVDLEHLAEFPDPAYKTIQFSSYDRLSVKPYAKHWYANSDGFGKEPVPNFLETLEEPGDDGVGKYLLAKVGGPGAIVRTWTANIKGDLRVVLDGQDTPLYEGPAAEFLRYTYSVLAKQAGLVEEHVADGFHQRESCYFPIPFAKGLRIEWTGNVREIHFYHLEVRLYPDGTAVQTFAQKDLVTYKAEIDRAFEILSGSDADSDREIVGKTTELDLDVEPGRKEELFRSQPSEAIRERRLKVDHAIEASGEIRELRLKLDHPDLHRGLRQVLLKGYFDGAPWPQIEAPLGDFFGGGPGLNPYESLPMRVEADGTLVCRFVMPFQNEAHFVIENLSEESVGVSGSVTVSEYAWNDRSLHFFAKWRVDHDLVAGGNAGVYDLPYLSARGKGVFVGASAQILNPADIPTSSGNWWGEGDEKIWFDDDAFPSFFGTGSEDYYNYAWSQPDLFHYPYFAQPLVTGPGNRGFNVNLRWHILDPLPFEERIDFFMELFHHSKTEGISYARTAYFYGEPGIRDTNRPIMKADVTSGLEIPAGWKPRAEAGASGAIFFEPESLVRGEADLTTLRGAPWSENSLLVWDPEADGDELVLEFEVPESGNYRFAGTFARTPESGRVAFRLDDREEMGHVADLHTPHQTMLRTDWFDTLELEAGKHTLTLISKGKSEASGGDRIGIDFIWVRAR